MLVYNFIILCFALAIIFWSADRLIIASVALSDRWKIPPLIVGAVIIGFGTSSPELAVSVLAALDNESLISIGNVFGSNIANLSLVAGSAALFTGICIDQQTLTRRFPVLIAATLLPGLLIINLALSRIDAILMLVGLGGFLFLLVRESTETTLQTEPNSEDETMRQNARRLKFPIIWLLTSLIVLLISCNITVRMAVTIAEALHISKLVIGLTVIAIGTSLPELAAALIGAYHKQHSIAIGNILGSNIFNSLGVLGVAALIHPTSVPAELLYRDFSITLGLTLLIWLLFIVSRNHCIKKKEGLLLLSSFTIYLVWLYFSVVK